MSTESKKWIIRTAMGNIVNNGLEYDSFEDARDACDELASIEASNNYNFKTDPEAWEELYQGIVEDLYAEEVEND